MIKKTILIGLFVLFSSILIYGGVKRTTAKTGEEARLLTQTGTGQSAQAANGERLYRNRLASTGDAELRQSPGRGGQGNWQDAGQSEGYGQGSQGSGGGRGQQRNFAETESHEFVTIEGIVTQAPAAGIDMLLATDAGEVQIGTGPGYLNEVGYVITDGEQLTLTGFWEDGEFKVSEITRGSDGASVTLRDEFGRPMWSGAVRNGGGGPGRAAG